MIFTKVCESCIHKKKLFKKKVEGSTVKIDFVDCKLKGIIEAPSEIRRRPKKGLCKDYEDNNLLTYELIEKGNNWIWKKKGEE